MTRPDRHLSWESFLRLIEGGPPAVEQVKGEPAVQIFVDANGERIGIRAPCESDLPPSPLQEIKLSRTNHDGSEVIELSTTNRLLYRDFHSLCCSVADRIQVDGMPSAIAVESALGAWESLLRQLTLLSEDKQTGLMGELMALRRLQRAIGWEAAIAAWKGPESEEHDFSWHQTDIEVKTTISERRSHIIGSLSQLTPSPERLLYLLSYQLTTTGPGAGQTLVEAITSLESDVTRHASSALASLGQRLHDSGWRSDHAEQYQRRLVLRTPPALIRVDANCPRLTKEVLSGLEPNALARVTQVSYRVDVTDMGFEDGTDEFHSVIPKGNLT